MSTHRRDPTNKRARFAPINPQNRNQYTPPSSPFLSRSATEMNNPSPYDSGYDSSFSTASGPGKPPSSRGNSDIDDQVDRYIRDQRVATLINTSNDNPNAGNITQPHTSLITTAPPTNPSHLRTQRAIADQHRAIAEHHLNNHDDTDSDQPPPLIPDSDTDEYDATDADIPLPFNRRYDAPETTNTHTQQERPQYSSLRAYTQTTNRTPYVENSRIAQATTHSPSTRTDTLQSSTPAPPLMTPIQPIHTRVTLTQKTTYRGTGRNINPKQRQTTTLHHMQPQFADWIDSQLTWDDFRRSIPAFKNMLPEFCSPPIIHRPFPNYQYMHNTQDPTADP